MKVKNTTNLYIGLLLIIALLLVTFVYFNYGGIKLKDIIFWGALAIIAESLLVFLPKNDVGLSVGSAINLAAILLGGPLLGTCTTILGFLFRVTNVPGKGYIHLFNTPYFITVYNVAQAAIGTSLMGILYVETGGVIGHFYILQTIFILMMGILINTLIISGLISIVEEQKFTILWMENIKGTFLGAIAVGTLGVIIFLAFISYGYGAVLLFFGPLLLARHSFKLYIDMRNVYISTIDTLNKTIEAKDPYTSGHANRVMEYSVNLAEAYGLNYNQIENIKKAAILHDIGKIGIDDSILHKAGKLTEEEYLEIQKHPVVGADILKKMDFLKEVSEIVRYHHERYDGKGYPKGLKGDSIPIESYILSIADSYDAMTSDRPYRKALEKDIALGEIQKNGGSQFHPHLAEIFVGIMS